MQGDSALAFGAAAESTVEPCAGTRLAQAADHLEDVLEAVDLEHDRELAEAVLAAVAATDRAYRLQTDRGDRRRRLAREIDAASRVE